MHIILYCDLNLVVPSLSPNSFEVGLVTLLLFKKFRFNSSNFKISQLLSSCTRRLFVKTTLHGFSKQMMNLGIEIILFIQYTYKDIFFYLINVI